MPLLISFSFLIWIYCFRDFVSGKYSLASDALAYVEHFKFYIDQISRGVYPLWDPTREGGVPIEFFLRRIGSHNPLFFLIIILQKCGLSFLHAYLSFLTVYFFLGTIGFYLIAKQIFKDSFYAFTAFLLLLFSSLGTRIFDSYIILTFTPMMWFFYFLIKWGHIKVSVPIPIYFIGCIFTLMILFNTYLPFYFLTILVTFLISCAAVYWKETRSVFVNFCVFSKQHKMLVGFWLSVLLISLLPGLMLFQEMKKGEIVLPMRQPPGISQSSAEVDPIWVTKWGVEEDIIYSSVFLKDLKKFKFAIFYLPVFAYLMFFSGVMLKFNRRLAFFLCWMLMLILISAQQLPVYHFLKEHIVFFKYFRNLHFFLWLALLPIFILFVIEQLKKLKEEWPLEKRRQNLYAGFLVVVHAGFLLYVLTQTKFIISTLLTIGLSLIFLIFWLQGRFKFQFWLCGGVLMLVILEAVQIFSYLPKNFGVLKERPYRYENPYLNLRLPEKNEWEMNPKSLQSLDVNRKQSSIYMGLKWYNFLDQMIPKEDFIFEHYLDKKFILYDKIEFLDLKRIDLPPLLQTIVFGNNTAYVTASANDMKTLQVLSKVAERSAEEIKVSAKAQIVTSQDGSLEVISYDVNNVKFITHFEKMKFLVYNDGYDQEWRGFIDGNRLDIWRTNLTFKGMWVPAGEHIIELRYGSLWQYWFNGFLLALFFGVFVYLLSVLWKMRFQL